MFSMTGVWQERTGVRNARPLHSPRAPYPWSLGQPKQISGASLSIEHRGVWYRPRGQRVSVGAPGTTGLYWSEQAPPVISIGPSIRKSLGVRPSSQPHPPFTHVSDFIKTQLFTLIANFPAPANSNVRPAAEPTRKETEYPAHGSCF
jgi:hypothetical protein